MKEIVFKDGMVAKESLPLPSVLYPGHYGAFIAFKSKEHSSEAFFCVCAYEAMKNYIVHRLAVDSGENANPNRMFLLDSMYFPLQVVEECRKKDLPQDELIMSHLNFKRGICHECTKSTPSYRHCHEMYGGIFKQTYGWYIQKQACEWGVFMDGIDSDFCPQKVLDLAEISHEEYCSVNQRRYKEERKTYDHWIQNNPHCLSDEFSEKRIEKRIEISALCQGKYARELYDMQAKYAKQKRKVMKVVENEVRTKFGHKKIGEAWTSETILYYIVKKLFPNATIKRHYRPKFLKGLELDVFIEDLNLGIEYQGIQHYQPVKHWGGKDALKKVQERDAKKKLLCEQTGVNLLYFEYDDELSESFVYERIEKYKS